MRVLIACEFSGIVREAFGDAWSCDLLPTEIPGNHLQCNVLDIIDDGWDLMIAFPPCTHLASSGARWFKYKQQEQQDAIDFVKQLMDAPIPKIAIENPVGILSTAIRKPDQIIQPYQFGHPESKRTCLWLKNLPLLTPTKNVKNKGSKIYRVPSGPDQWKERSRTYPGIAKAMVQQWKPI